MLKAVSKHKACGACTSGKPQSLHDLLPNRLTASPVGQPVTRLTKLSGQQIKPLTTSQLGRFCTDTHKLINSSNHNLANQQIVTKVQDNVQNLKFKRRQKVSQTRCFVILLADTVLAVALESCTLWLTAKSNQVIPRCSAL